MPNPSTIARDEHGPIKAGVSFERHPAELAAESYHARSRVICQECEAKDAMLLAQAARMECMADQLRRVAEREAKRDQPWPPPEMIEP